MKNNLFLKTSMNIKEQKNWNNKANHPLQTWEWGEFRKAWGNEVIRFPFGQMTLHKIPFLKLRLAIFEKGPPPTKRMLETLYKFAKERSLILIKMEPNVPVSIKSLKGEGKIKNFSHLIYKRDKFTKLLSKFKLVSGKTILSPTTLWIDLTKSEEELLKNLHPKTRYNIRLAKKKGVEVFEDNSDKAFEKYIQLTRETVKRQNFYAHTERYHWLMWDYLHKLPISNHQPPIARLLVSKYRNETLSAWILFVWKDFLYYPYGASSEKYKNVKANNLMMWEAIKYGRKNNLKIFDLWGREEGKGFTRFKEGYNPYLVESLGSWDMKTSRFYWPYRVSEFLRWQILRIKKKIIKPSF